MVDYYRTQQEGVPTELRTWFQEVGHESHGEVVSASEIWRADERGDNRSAADDDWEAIVPEHEEWEILWITVAVTTTATVGNRQMGVAAYQADGDLQGLLATAGAVQAASTTRYYTFAPGLADLTSFRDTNVLTTPLPRRTILCKQQHLRVWDNKHIDPLDTMEVHYNVVRRLVEN